MLVASRVCGRGLAPEEFGLVSDQSCRPPSIQEVRSPTIPERFRIHPWIAAGDDPMEWQWP